TSRPLFGCWVGSNDSSTAALGEGGSKPSFLPIPFEQVAAELTPLARALLAKGEAAGELSFEPYTQAAIDRNLTLVEDFAAQYGHLLARLKSEVSPAVTAQLFLLTLPYYSSVGYLMDSEDLEFYFRKLNPDYTVPASFKRAIRSAAPAYGPNAHVVEIADYLNAGLTGETPIVIGDTVLSRKWIRGSSFGFDGVHPNYTAQALIANFVLGKLNAALGLN